MIITLITLETAPFWQGLASILGSAALWAQQRAKPEKDPVEELTFRLRHPVRAALASPIVTLRRKADRRRAVND